MPVPESLKSTTEVLILLFVRNDGWISRQFARSTISKINQFKNITHSYQVIFVFGTGSTPTAKQMSDWKNETIQFHDILLLDAVDSYHTVVFKEVSGFTWALEAFASHKGQSSLKWIIKTDDDVLFKPNGLDELITRHSGLFYKQVLSSR